MASTTVHGEPAPKETGDLLADHLEVLRLHFPQAFTEGKVDFDKLRQALGDAIDDRPERYSFTWAGKRDAIRVLQTPSRATLVPAPEESVDFEQTGNLFIEGDNLEVLKLLYKPYFGRVKMIYIDPPYNTGNDFIYPDNFADPLDTYLRLTGQKDSAGNLLTSNPETSGRYHSAWLSMMYPRLFLARQLLREDGVIFVSIDDHEVDNLRLVMNEVFGDENFVAVFVRKRRMPTGMRDDLISPDHEYVLAYAKSSADVRLFGKPRQESDYPFEDAKGKYRSTDLTVGMTRNMRPKQYYAIRNPRTGKEYLPPEDRVWRFQPTVMQGHTDQDNIIWPDERPERNLTRPRFKTRFDPSAIDLKTSPVSTWIDTKRSETSEEEEGERTVLMAGMNQEGTKQVTDLLDVRVVEYPKPVSLLKALINLATAKSDTVLDFFAGSGTTAHALLEMNHEDDGDRRFIMVQFPEPTPDDSSARKAGYATIAEIGKERIRRVIFRTRKDCEGKLEISTRDTPEDLGFRVFKLAESNYKSWAGVQEKDGEAYTEQMALFTDQLVEVWSPEDVIWEAAIKEGYALSSRIDRLQGDFSNTVFRVSDSEKQQSFFICLDDVLDPVTVNKLALGSGDLFVCRDAALDDEVAANLALQCRLKTL